jgi:hypothetical protein
MNSIYFILIHRQFQIRPNMVELFMVKLIEGKRIEGH